MWEKATMEKKRSEELLYTMAEILIPVEYLKDFEISNVKNSPDEWLIELQERKERIPKELQGKEAVLDGFCNPLDVMTHAFSLKRIYLRLYRRRWKEKGQDKHYSNQYDLHIPGMKTTKALGDFLKENDREASG